MNKEITPTAHLEMERIKKQKEELAQQEEALKEQLEKEKEFVEIQKKEKQFIEECNTQRVAAANYFMSLLDLNKEYTIENKPVFRKFELYDYSKSEPFNQKVYTYKNEIKESVCFIKRGIVEIEIKRNSRYSDTWRMTLKSSDFEMVLGYQIAGRGYSDKYYRSTKTVHEKINEYLEEQKYKNDADAEKEMRESRCHLIAKELHPSAVECKYEYLYGDSRPYKEAVIVTFANKLILVYNAVTEEGKPALSKLPKIDVSKMEKQGTIIELLKMQ